MKGQEKIWMVPGFGVAHVPSLSCLRLKYLNSVQLSCWVVIRDSGLGPHFCPRVLGGALWSGEALLTHCCFTLPHFSASRNPIQGQNLEKGDVGLPFSCWSFSVWD